MELSDKISDDYEYITDLVNFYMKDKSKTKLWMNAPHPTLHGRTPFELLLAQRMDKVLLAVKEQFKDDILMQ